MYKFFFRCMLFLLEDFSTALSMLDLKKKTCSPPPNLCPSSSSSQMTSKSIRGAHNLCGCETGGLVLQLHNRADQSELKDHMVAVSDTRTMLQVCYHAFLVCENEVKDRVGKLTAFWSRFAQALYSP